VFVVRLPTLLLSASIALFAAAGASAQAPAKLELKGADGKSVGTVALSEGPSGVLVSVEVAGLTPGWHGMHFHQTGDCSDAGFQKSGGHINHAEAKKPHGLLNPQGPDFGDLPNLFVGADGAGKAQAFSALVSLGGADGRPALNDADGSALVIHAGADDHTTQPIGGAGARVACAVIR
jgi:Cu-Zn family superoxide dismutase